MRIDVPFNEIITKLIKMQLKEGRDSEVISAILAALCDGFLYLFEEIDSDKKDSESTLDLWKEIDRYVTSKIKERFNR